MATSRRLFKAIVYLRVDCSTEMRRVRIDLKIHSMICNLCKCMSHSAPLSEQGSSAPQAIAREYQRFTFLPQLVPTLFDRTSTAPSLSTLARLLTSNVQCSSNEAYWAMCSCTNVGMCTNTRVSYLVCAHTSLIFEESIDVNGICTGLLTRQCLL